MLNGEALRFATYPAAMILIWAFYWIRRRSVQRRTLDALRVAQEAGLTDPPSLHPTINTALCIGCRSCVTACPEGGVLGVINGKAQLINPSDCIGHGACKTACPMRAIDLVFGSAVRGVDIPVVSADFETNVPGIYIAGELGGMGLIRNAAEQGRQAIAAIMRHLGAGDGSHLDVVIVGAGPAGFAASLAAHERKLRFVTVEQEQRGGTVAHYPRGKIVVTGPIQLPIVGKMRIRETTKEALLQFWQEIEQRTGLRVHYNERVESIARNGSGFVVTTARETYHARAVLLATGRRGTPRRLAVPGEDLPKVVYRLIDPAQYRGQRVLVVGGGDSAIEAATTLTEQPDTTVTLSYRGSSFSRARPANRERLQAAQSEQRLSVMLESRVVDISPERVAVVDRHGMTHLANDAVIVCAGGVLPTQFLRDIGVEVQTKYGTA
ncbi:MAG: NAD(P)-binding domain-containing protein [Deltaproteobacteria bacterium]|nr:NAD(P)-binding domain-containing protein [Deltaproteobacteria bacterium]